jgi:hypothetical protein
MREQVAHGVNGLPIDRRAGAEVEAANDATHAAYPIRPASSDV